MPKGNGRCDWTEYWTKKREWESRRPTLIKKLFVAVENKCVNCGSVERLTADHIRPLRKEGTNAMNNLQILCMDCNRSKGAR